MAQTIISETENGLVFFCSGCKLLHLEFKNVNLNFTKNQINEFSEYLEKIDKNNWERINQNSPFRRKISIPLFNGHFNFMINFRELQELKKLTHAIRNSIYDTILKNMNNISRCN